MAPVISVQVYSVRDAFAADPAGTLARIAECGYENVEPYGLSAELERALAESGLSAPSAHARLLTDDAPLDELFETANRIGTGILIHPAVEKGWDDDAEIGRIADRLNAVAAKAAAAGITVGYHNHWWELGDIGGRHALEVFADRLDRSVVLEVDVYWTAVGGADPADLIRRLGGRVRLLHLKDGPIEQKAETQVPVGSGRIDVPSVLEAAPDAIRIVEFDAYAGDLFEGIAQSLEYVRRVDQARA